MSDQKTIKVTLGDLRRGVPVSAGAPLRIIVVPEEPLLLEVAPEEPLLLEVAPEEPLLLEFEDSFFLHKSAVLLPEGSNDDDTFGFTTVGLDVIATSLHLLEQTDKTWLVVGHADTTGANTYNDALSKHRADCVLAALTGDRELFKTVAHGPHFKSDKERTGVQRDAHVVILNWAHNAFGWPCRLKDNRGDYVEAVREFQRLYNRDDKMGNASAPTLKPDGDWGPLTWGAVFDGYELELARDFLLPIGELPALRSRLRVDARAAIPATPAVGCGEHCPIENAEIDNFRSATNKRVEVLFFDEGEVPAVQCPNGTCDLVQSTWYRDSQTRARISLPRVQWEFQRHAARVPDLRSIMISAPGLPDGENILLDVRRFAADQSVKVVSGEVLALEGGTATRDFDDHAPENNEGLELDIRTGERFPSHSFRAEVSIRGLRFFSRPLPFHRDMALAFYDA